MDRINPIEEYLHTILDEIDSLTDSIKPKTLADYEYYISRANALCEKRHKPIMTSNDGVHYSSKTFKDLTEEDAIYIANYTEQASLNYYYTAYKFGETWVCLDSPQYDHEYSSAHFVILEAESGEPFACKLGTLGAKNKDEMEEMLKDRNNMQLAIKSPLRFNRALSALGYYN